MSRRFFIALAVGGVLGGGAVLGFGPYVRGKIADKAARYGAEVEVEAVTPSWAGVRLSGVSVTIAEIPGVNVELSDVVVGWTDRRLVSMDGGKITAVGELGELAAHVDRWRAARMKSSGDGSGSAGRKLSIDGFSVDWKNAAAGATQTISATGLSLERDKGVVSIEADKMNGAVGQVRVAVEGGTLVLDKRDDRYRIEELTSSALMLELQTSGDPLNATPPPEAAPAASGADDKAAPEGDDKAVKQVVHRRVLAARAAVARLFLAARELDDLVAPEARISVGGAKARIVLDSGALNLGPGTLRLTRDDSDMVVALEPRVDTRPDAKALTFSMRIPLQDDDNKPVRAQLSGGPVWLSMLGVQDGDLGLKNVAQTSIEADVRVELPTDGSTVSVDGRGKVRDLAVANKRIAAEPLEKIELAWRAKFDAKLDGSKLEVHDAEVDLGHLRGFFKGRYDRHEGGHKIDMTYEIPLVTCQRVFESIPEAMVPKLKGMRFVGSLSMKGHAKFDTAALMKTFDVGWDGSLGCRIVEVPSAVDVASFRSKFRKLVYSPSKEERMQDFGPDQPEWVALGSIARYMTGAVLTTEDGRFFRHAGFDQEAIVNSIRENIREERFVRGASTISMQLAKNLYLPRTKTIARKLQEAVLTMYLEQELTKNEMLELYLNIIEYGPDVYGIGPAARHYFNSHPSRLSLGQSLYLASILANPAKQYFGAGGAVIGSRMSYLRILMKIVHKIGRISEDELDVGLRETVVFGSSSILAPLDDDPYAEEDGSDDDPTSHAGDGSGDGYVDPWSG